VTLRQKVGLGIVGLAALLAAASPLYERFFGRTRLRFPYLAKPIAQAEYDRFASQPGWARAPLEVASGIKLNGLLRRPTHPAAPWVLFFPGNDESQLRMGQAFLSRLAGDLGWGLAVFAYRGYDSSDGTPRLAELAEDAPRIAERLAATEQIGFERLHLVGFSIGGHFAVHAARGLAERGKRAKSLTLLASVDDIVMVPRSPWERLSPGDDYQTRPLLPAVPAPVLVLQGVDDVALGGAGQGRAIAGALGAKARYEELAGVGHEGLLENDRALTLVRDFIAEHAR
jgi:pimeloyl-ACP methyl ester carboxylesterase